LAYLYGDSTESPLETNYIEFLRDALDFSVAILVGDYRVQALQESCEDHKRSAEGELQQLRALSEKVNQLMAEPFGPPQSPAQRCAAQIRQGADDAIMRMAGQIKQNLSDQLAQVAGQVQRERSSPLRAIEMLLRHRDLPDSTSHIEVALGGARSPYVAQVRGRADIGLEWVQALEVPASHLFAQLVKVERLSPNLEVKLPEKGGWRRKGVRVRAHRLGASYITEVMHAAHQATVKLRATPEDDENGYNIVVSGGEPRVRLIQVSKGGEHSPPFEPMEEDLPRFLELAVLATEAATELSQHRGALREARIDGKALSDFENPSLLVKRLVAKMAPVVTEIARHSLAPDELVLKRVVTDDRREEIFAAKADLIAKLDPVPIALRGVFAPLGLGDLGRPGPNSGRMYPAEVRGSARHERIDTNEPVTETKEVRPPPRTSELPPMSTLPGMTPMPMPAVAVRPGDARSLAHAQTLTAAAAAAAAARSGPVNPTVRGMNPLQAPARSTNPNGYPVPGNSGRVMSPDPAKRLPADEDDVTIVADQREKTRPPGQLGGKNSEDSIDVALSELEHES
jgi:hypothetical protein